MSATSLAVILIVQQFLFIVTKPAIGFIADYFNKLKAVICILLIVEAIFFFLYLAIPKIEKNTELNDRTISRFKILNFSYLVNRCEFHQHVDIYNFTNKDILNFSNNSEILNLVSREHSSKFDCDYPAYAAEEIFDVTDQKIINKNSSHLSFLSDYKELFVFANSSNSVKPIHCIVYCKFTRYCYSIPCDALEYNSEETSGTSITSDFQTYQFWLFGLFHTIAMTCASALFTLTDTACCESVEKTGANFGRQRIWGAISWAIVCPIGGFLNDYTDSYLTSWIMMAVISALALWNMQSLDLVKPHNSQNILKDVGLVFRSKEFLVFEANVLANGIATGLIWYYFMWFLATIGGTRFLLGMVQCVQCVLGEIPFMFFSDWVIGKVGHFSVLTSSLLSYAIRFFYYSRLYNPWLVLPVECLHGITYGIYYTALASYAKVSAKPGTEATTQSVLFVTHEGLGGGIGCVMAGIGFDHLGAHQTFFYAGIFSGCATFLSIILNLWIRQQKGSIAVTPSSKA